MITANEKANALDEKIVSFLRGQTNMTLAVSENNIPYCANCFYAFDEKENLLIFKSKAETTHVKIALKNNKVAGTIIPDSLDRVRIQGIQFTGDVFQPGGEIFSAASFVYYKKFPFALVVQGELWAIKLCTIKFTDNQSGFGKRLEWKRGINEGIPKC